MTTKEPHANARTAATDSLEYYLPATFQQASEPSRLERFLSKHFYWPSGW